MVNRLVSVNDTFQLPAVVQAALPIDKGLPVFNVMKAPYNAVGDGVADDTIAIQAAIDAANAAKGGIVFFPGTHRITATLNCVGITDVTLQGTSRAHSLGSGIKWAGADNGITIQGTDAIGLAIIGLAFTAGSATFAGTHINFESTVWVQCYHILIEWCFFAGGGGTLHTNIRTGSGHNYTIRDNDFYKADVSIRGWVVGGGPAGNVNSALIQRNWFGMIHNTAHITDPGAGWRISCNAVEVLPSASAAGSGGFIRLLSSAPFLVNVTIEDNWCGDSNDPAVIGATTGAVIEMAGGPFEIRNNLLAAVGPGTSSIKAVGALTGGALIESNRSVGAAAGSTFIDWGAFTHATTPNSGTVHVRGNLVQGTSVLYAGTIPAKLIDDTYGYQRNPIKAFYLISIVAGVATIDADVMRAGAYILLSANVTTMTVSNPVGDGQVLMLRLRQDGSGTKTFAWPATFHWVGGSAPTCTGAFSTTTVTMQWDGTRWIEMSRAANIT